MALLKMGAIVTALSGKIGGQTIGISRFGQYIKNTGTYINQATPKRKKANAFLAVLTSHWRKVKQGDKDAWTALAPAIPYINRLGNSVVYSGFNLFVRWNYNVVLINKAIQDAPLPLSILTPAKIIDLKLNGAKIDLTIPDGDNAVFCKIYISQPMSLGDNQYKKRLRYAGFYDIATLKATIDIVPLIQTLFGQTMSLTKYYVVAMQFDPASGQPIGDDLVGFIDNV